MIQLTMKKIFVWLSAVGVAIGIACRFIIFNISFEYDEIFTAVTSNPAVPFSYIWKNYLLVDVHPPLHNILLWVYNHWVPYGPEWALRWPSLILSVTSLFLAWKLFPRYLGKTARWIFVLLLSCNFYLLLYAQHARAYSLLICLAVVLTYLYLQIARCLCHKHTVSREIWVWYGICSLLLCWSHYFGALLFGLFSVILFFIAWNHKQPLRYCIAVPLLVLAGFLPWLIPNLLENLSQHRFSGNWWGNQALSWHLVKLWVEFFFSSVKAFYVLLSIGALGIIYTWYRQRKLKVWLFSREIILVFLPMAAAGLFALAMSVKIFWLLWRYFIPFVPCLYLFVTLIIAPVCKRYRVIGLAFLCFVALSFQAFIRMRNFFQEGIAFPVRSAMEIYKQGFADKALYTVALEAFPPNSMQPMYAFYPQIYFGVKQPVYELFHMNPTQRDQLLEQADQALLWMPNCDPKKMKKLAQTFQRNISIFARFSNVCFLLPAQQDRRTFNENQRSEYLHRFEKARHMLTRPQRPRR